MNKKTQKTILLSIMMVCFFMLGSLLTSLFYINEDTFYRTFVTMDYYNVSENITEEEVMELCNVSGDEYVECLNDVFVSHVKSDLDDCRDRGYKTYSALDVLNIGKGCCRDAAEFYSYYLDKKGIENQLVYVPKDNPNHVFVVASIVSENGSLETYRILDFGLLW